MTTRESKTVEQLIAFSSGIEGQGIEDHQNCTYTSGELRCLASELVKLNQGDCVVEIGVYGGRSTSLYLQLQPELNLDVHLIDNWSWDQQRATSIFVKMLLDHFNEVPFTLHKMLSAYLATNHWNRPIHFLHIDGWHDMPGIEPDCRLWLPFVVPGGVVAFHDSDCPPVTECIGKYCKGWVLISAFFRTTVWRKPNVAAGS